MVWGKGETRCVYCTQYYFTFLQESVFTIESVTTSKPHNKNFTDHSKESVTQETYRLIIWGHRTSWKWGGWHEKLNDKDRVGMFNVRDKMRNEGPTQCMYMNIEIWVWENGIGFFCIVHKEGHKANYIAWKSTDNCG